MEAFHKCDVIEIWVVFIAALKGVRVDITQIEIQYKQSLPV